MEDSAEKEDSQDEAVDSQAMEDSAENEDSQDEAVDSQESITYF